MEAIVDIKGDLLNKVPIDGIALHHYVNPESKEISIYGRVKGMYNLQLVKAMLSICREYNQRDPIQKIEYDEINDRIVIFPGINNEKKISRKSSNKTIKYSPKSSPRKHRSKNHQHKLECRRTTPRTALKSMTSHGISMPQGGYLSVMENYQKVSNYNSIVEIYNAMIANDVIPSEEIKIIYQNALNILSLK
jgi:hypothetical protein